MNCLASRKYLFIILLYRSLCPKGVRIIGRLCSTSCTAAKETLYSVPFWFSLILFNHWCCIRSGGIPSSFPSPYIRLPDPPPNALTRVLLLSTFFAAAPDPLDVKVAHHRQQQWRFTGRPTHNGLQPMIFYIHYSHHNHIYGQIHLLLCICLIINHVFMLFLCWSNSCSPSLSSDSPSYGGKISFQVFLLVLSLLLLSHLCLFHINNPNWIHIAISQINLCGYYRNLRVIRSYPQLRLTITYKTISCAVINTTTLVLTFFPL